MCNHATPCNYLNKLDKCLLCLDKIEWLVGEGQEHTKRCLKCGAYHDIMFTGLGPRIDVSLDGKVLKRLYNTGVLKITGVDMIKEVDNIYLQQEEDEIKMAIDREDKEEKSEEVDKKDV